MAFPRKLLNDHEELVLDLRPHWAFLVKQVLLLALAIVLGGAALFYKGSGDSVLKGAAAIFVLVALGIFGWRYAKWTTTNFVLTTDRIISRKGVVSKQGIEIPLERVNSVFFHQGPLERMLGAGDLAIESAGERGSESFTDIRRPAVVQREIYVQMENNENRKYDRMSSGVNAGTMAAAAAAPAAAPLSVAEQLEKLHDLVQQGALTPEQFEAEKQKLLGS